MTQWLSTSVALHFLPTSTGVESWVQSAYYQLAQKSMAPSIIFLGGLSKNLFPQVRWLLNIPEKKNNTWRHVERWVMCPTYLFQGFLDLKDADLKSREKQPHWQKCINWCKKKQKKKGHAATSSKCRLSFSGRCPEVFSKLNFFWSLDTSLPQNLQELNNKRTVRTTWEQWHLWIPSAADGQLSGFWSTY